MNEITEQLWVSDITSAWTAPAGRFDRVVTVCQDSIEDNVGCAYDHFELADGVAGSTHGGECSYELFEAAADAVAEALRNDEVVLVHCHAGISRSTSVSAAALADVRDCTYTEAFETVKRNRPGARPAPVLRGYGFIYTDDPLAETSGSD